MANRACHFFVRDYPIRREANVGVFRGGWTASTRVFHSKFLVRGFEGQPNPTQSALFHIIETGDVTARHQVVGC